ncbi:hypothetical protein [Actinomadura opuntiae]|uniref:hypothetical protein n=1 Tax=Actinomadura sp. OS1-43 TaxID=604315 RepID=UPI00255B0102|nr:hypothetical protein [Actinomadura sp. OS1-43]MDL4813105.1 hypothetical protein [Actinomadura sp. OS1-43]
MLPSTQLIMRKTRTAADYVHTHSPNPLTRRRAAVVLRHLATVHAAVHAAVHADASAGSIGDMGPHRPESVEPAALRGLLAAVAECAGSSWLRANSHDPDIGRLAALLDAPHLVPGDPAELDELLATVLWASHGPQPEPS